MSYARICWVGLAVIGCATSEQGPGETSGGRGGTSGTAAAGGSGGASGSGGSGGIAGSGGSSGASGTGGAGGAAGGGGTSNPADPLNADPRCSSGLTWTPADGNTRHMRPGEGCAREAACHGAGTTNLTLAVAGTVFPTGHEPDDCHGIDTTVPGADLIHVVVTDAAGTEMDMLPNDVGNFYLTASLTFPLHAKLTTASGKERPMLGPIDSGDCDGCHTQRGDSGAPGRLTVPF